MKKVRIAVDVDGTLRCDCTETCRDPNLKIVRLFNILAVFKNTEMYVWSAGGADYAREFADLFGLHVAHSHCISKLDAPQMDIAIDDQQAFDLGTFNLIVREK